MAHFDVGSRSRAAPATWIVPEFRVVDGPRTGQGGNRHQLEHHQLRLFPIVSATPRTSRTSWLSAELPQSAARGSGRVGRHTHRRPDNAIKARILLRSRLAIATRRITRGAEEIFNCSLWVFGHGEMRNAGLNDQTNPRRLQTKNEPAIYSKLFLSQTEIRLNTFWWRRWI